MNNTQIVTMVKIKKYEKIKKISYSPHYLDQNQFINLQNGIIILI